MGRAVDLCTPKSFRLMYLHGGVEGLGMLRLGCVVLFCCALSGCRSRKPSIRFSQVPTASFGGDSTRGTVAGSVTDAVPGARIVLYAKGEKDKSWWVQPTVSAPYTAIRPDGTWVATIHLGMEFAALLVDSSYKPGTQIESLPKAGGGVLAVADVPAHPTILEQMVFVPKHVTFSNYDWIVQTRPTPNGGKMHYYDPSNVWVDEAGAMHLKVTRIANQWVCAEARTVRNLGFGSYRFRLRDTGMFEPGVALGMFTWSSQAPEENGREMDIHVSRWGSPENKNAEFVIQPYYVASNVYRFEMPAGRVTTGFDWSEGKATFLASRGTGGGEKPFATWTFTTGVPASADERVYVNFCEFGYSKMPMQHEAEVVIDSFQFLP